MNKVAAEALKRPHDAVCGAIKFFLKKTWLGVAAAPHKAAVSNSASLMADIKKTKRKMLDCHGGSLIIKTYREAAGGISSSAADRCAIMERVLGGSAVGGGRLMAARLMLLNACRKQLDNQPEVKKEQQRQGKS